MLKNITIALGAGFIGSLANILAIYLLNLLQGLSKPAYIFIYKQVFGEDYRLYFIVCLFSN
ncbi:hypothetical protein C0W35_21485 [Photobacterium kishitanii]